MAPKEGGIWLQPLNSVDKIYALFKEKLEELQLPSQFVVVNDPTSLPDGLRIKYHSAGMGFSNWMIDLQRYQPFLLRKMVPTLLFSLFLLGMIGLAFWSLITNWIKQHRLSVVKNEFISNVTHELKTPIATVGVALEAISNFDLSREEEKAKEYIDITRNEVNRLSLLVDKVLNVAAFDSNAAKLNLEKVDLNKIIKDIIRSLKLQFDSKNAKVEYHSENNDAVIVGDPLHMSNVVYNIVDNALKYSGTNPEIQLRLEENDNELILSVADNGKGIPKEYLDKVFDRFFRVPNDDIHDVKGHGLGLNYVKNVIEGHGGKITVSSQESIGTTFKITLPKSMEDA